MLPIENTELDIKHYINKNIEEGKNIGVDLKIFSVNYFNSLQNALNKHSLIYDEKNILDDIIPEVTCHSRKEKKSIFMHDLKYTGKSSLEKYNDVRNNLNELILSNNNNTHVLKSSPKSYAIVINKLDDIACKNIFIVQLFIIRAN